MTDKEKLEQISLSMEKFQRTFDYDRDWLQPEEPVKEHDSEQYIFRGGHWILFGEDYD
jgi:hypothetical protein